MLKTDHAFVGNASLVHAGSAQKGKRLHFEFVPRDGVEVIEKNAFSLVDIGYVIFQQVRVL